MQELVVLHADNHLLAVAKPASAPVVPDASGDPSLLDAAKLWIRREGAKPGRVFLAVVHRLDRPVSGVVLFARTTKAAGRLSEQFRARQVRKLYLAVVEGEVRGESGEIEQWLEKDECQNRVRVVDPGSVGARRAATHWRTLARRGERTLLELEPSTGRAHQLRVALSLGLGAAIVGDVKYGAKLALSDRSIALHALELEVEHPTRRERIALRCPLPERDWWREWDPPG